MADLRGTAGPAPTTGPAPRAGIAAGLGTRAARWALVTVWALGVAHGVLGETLTPAETLATGAPWRLAAYGCALLGALLLTTPGDGALARGRAAVVAGCALAAALLLFRGGAPVERLWLFDFSSYLPALLIARGNSVLGALGGGLLIGTGVGWAVTEGTASGAVELVAMPATALVVGVVWNIALRRIVAREQGHRSSAARAALAAEIAEENAIADRRELADVHRQAAPLLTRLAEGEAVGARELAVTEAAIRDRIRSPWVRHPVLTATITARREAGVDVRLLGESAGGRAPIGDALAHAVADLVARPERGTVTIRAMPAGRAGAVSVLLDDGVAATRVVLAENGAILSQG